MKERKKSMNKIVKIGIIVLVVAVLAVGSYFLINELKGSKLEKEMSIFEQGFTYGYTSAVIQIMNISDNCEPFPVYVGNESRTLISLDCLSS